MGLNASLFSGQKELKHTVIWCADVQKDEQAWKSTSVEEQNCHHLSVISCFHSLRGANVSSQAPTHCSLLDHLGSSGWSLVNRHHREIQTWTEVLILLMRWEAWQLFRATPCFYVTTSVGDCYCTCSEGTHTHAGCGHSTWLTCNISTVVFLLLVALEPVSSSSIRSSSPNFFSTLCLIQECFLAQHDLCGCVGAPWWRESWLPQPFSGLSPIDRPFHFSPLFFLFSHPCCWWYFCNNMTYC